MSSPLDSPDSQKAILRATALAARDALSGERRAAAAEAVAMRGLPFGIAPGAVVAGYSPIRSEIDPLPLMRRLAAQHIPYAAASTHDAGLDLVLTENETIDFRS